MDLSLLPRGAFPVTLDRERVVFFDMTATWMLIKKYGKQFLPSLYVPGTGTSIELVSMDALVFFLYAGLQKDAKDHGETLTLEQVETFVTSWNFEEVLRRVTYACVGVMATPAMLGEMRTVVASAAPAVVENPAAPSVPASPGPTKVSTPMKRSASPTPSSAGHRKGSGKSRPGSSTSRGKGTSKSGK